MRELRLPRHVKQYAVARRLQGQKKCGYSGLNTGFLTVVPFRCDLSGISTLPLSYSHEFGDSMANLEYVVTDPGGLRVPRSQL